MKRIFLILVGLFVFSCEDDDHCLSLAETDSEKSELKQGLSGGPPQKRHLPFFAGERIGVSQGNHHCCNDKSVCTHCNSLKYAVDFSRPHVTDRGLPVVSSTDGVVADAHYGCPDGSDKKCGCSAGKNNDCGWGNFVVVCSYNNTDCERLAHFREVFVRKNERVKVGQVVGTLGSSGNSTGPHLHHQAQNNMGGVSVAAEYLEVGNSAPQICGNCYLSQNAGQIERKFNQYSAAALGNVVSVSVNKSGWNGYHWKENYEYCDDTDDDAVFTCQNESDYRQNVYIRRFSGGQFGNAAIIYDALGGAREAYLIRSGFLKDSKFGWDVLGGPRSDLGNPLNDEYVLSNGHARQDFTWGYLVWDGSKVTWYRYPAVVNQNRGIGPGVHAPDSAPRWDGATSYLFADAWNRNGKSPAVGFPIAQYGNPAGVHVWPATRYFVQDFHSGQYGWCVIVYDPQNASYGGANQAFLVRTGFWKWYRENNGAQTLGAPKSDEYFDSSVNQTRQDFERGSLFWHGQKASLSPSNAATNSAPIPPADTDSDGDPDTSDCAPSDASVNHSAAEVCDGKDNNCDGAIDEGVKNACGSCGFAPQEICGNGKDDDCDGLTDEGCSSATCSEGAKDSCVLSCGATGSRFCRQGSWSSCQSGQEVCFNDNDDDCSGRADDNCGGLPATYPWCSGSELISDGDFEPNLGNWMLTVSNNASGTLSHNCARATSGSCSARLTGSGLNVYKNIDSVALGRALPALTPGSTYEITFDLREDSTNQTALLLEISENAPPWRNRGISAQIIPGAGTWDTIRLRFSPQTSSSGHRLRLLFGHLSQFDFSIDNMRIRACP